MQTPQVRIALDTGAPVIALESNVISSGLPYPHNIQVARNVERAALEEGVTPATIGLIRGEVHIGLSADEIEFLGTASDARKLSRRDLPLALARGWSGGTTVAATMYLAHQAGIRFLPPAASAGYIAANHSISLLTCPSWRRRRSWSFARAPSLFWICRLRWNGWKRTACPCWDTRPTSFQPFTPAIAD